MCCSRCQSSVSISNLTRITLTPSPLGWRSLCHNQVSSWSPGSGTPPPDARMMTSQTLVDSQVEAKPVFPELCLEHIWTENLGLPRWDCVQFWVQCSMSHVGKVFLNHCVIMWAMLGAAFELKWFVQSNCAQNEVILVSSYSALSCHLISTFCFIFAAILNFSWFCVCHVQYFSK